MVALANFLAYIDVMRYTRSQPPEAFSGLSRIMHEGETWGLSVIHTEEMSYPEVRGGDERLERRTHSHDVYHVVLYVSGENRFALEDGTHAARPGVLVLTSPGEAHAFGAFDPSPVVRSLELTFAATNGRSHLRLPIHQLLRLISGLELTPITFPQQLAPVETGRVRAQLDALLRRLLRRDALAWFDEQRLLLDLFHELLRAVYLPRPAASSAPRAALEQARETIARRMAEPLTLSELAQEACLSPPHFCRAFKKAFGLPPLAYQQQLRAQAAATLLRETPLRIGEIARRMGYSDVYAFSRAFRRNTGRSPRAFRNEAAAYAEG